MPEAIEEPPELAVVVIALGNSPETVDAVRSLLGQVPKPEIVVVNTGGSGMSAILRAAGLDVAVMEREARLFAGAARNIGIEATRAPYVAFLAEDCRAGRDWVNARLAAHRAGAPAVASALVNSHPRSAVAWAAHISSFSARLPGLPKGEGIAYGASYARALFETHGLFREDLRTGEDTEFNERLPVGSRPLWSSEVRTVHVNPTRLGAALVSQYQRGKRWAQAQGELGLVPKFRGFQMWRHRVRFSIHNSRRACQGPERRVVKRSWLILPFLSAAFCLGAHREGMPRAARTVSVARDAEFPHGPA
jgi:glycosyltransferase involved in cell wall biosynthesis